MDKENVTVTPEGQEKPKKNKLAGKIVYFALLAVFIGVFIYSALYILDYTVESHKTGNEYEDLASRIESLRDRNANKDPEQGDQDPTGAVNPTQGEDGPESPVLPEYRELHDKYPHLVGWIKVPGTKVDYPVMQSVDQPNFYLDHGYDGEEARWGAIYVREACDVFTPCDNVVIYGHRMNDGSMFAGLFAYEKKDYWEENQYLTFDTIYERHTYQIIAVFKTSANPGQGFAYHVFNTARDEAEFNDFMANVHELQMYDTGVTAEYGDMLITLSTCTPRHQLPENGRFVVVAKRVE